jgi:hypothetical protein
MGKIWMNFANHGSNFLEGPVPLRESFHSGIKKLNFKLRKVNSDGWVRLG